MKIAKIVKQEAFDWKWYEILGLFIVFAVIFYNAFILKDNLVAVCSAICGILYTIIAGKGKIYCYFFGLMGSGCYVKLSFVSHLWGNALLYLAYYIPMQIYGIFSWKKHLKIQSVEIVKTKLSAQDRIKFLVISFIGCFLTILILRYYNDSEPIIDGITTFLSILGMYFTVKRLLEQWIVWIVVNGLSFLMWLNIVLAGTKAYSTLVMWGVYFVLAIYFYFEWKKEINN